MVSPDFAFLPRLSAIDPESPPRRLTTSKKSPPLEKESLTERITLETGILTEKVESTVDTQESKHQKLQEKKQSLKPSKFKDLDLQSMQSSYCSVSCDSHSF